MPLGPSSRDGPIDAAQGSLPWAGRKKLGGRGSGAILVNKCIEGFGREREADPVSCGESRICRGKGGEEQAIMGCLLAIWGHPW